VGKATRHAFAASVRALLALVGLALACGSGASLPPKDPSAPTAVASALPRASKAAAGALGPARSHLLGAIARKAIGPLAAYSSEGGIAAWITRAEHGNGSELLAVPFGADGAPLRPPLVVASLPREATALVLQPTGRARLGWWLVWTAIVDRGESITLLELAQDGTARGTPIMVERTSDHIVWADLLPTTHGALCLWAEQPGTGDANVLAASIDPDGKPRGIPVRVARDVERWAAVVAGEGAALALVTRTSKGAGQLSWVVLDAGGSASSAPVAVTKEPSVSSDVDVVASDQGWVLAWTDRTGEDAQVMLAAIDAMGRVRGPRKALESRGGSELLSLSATKTGVAIAWEEPHARVRRIRTVHLTIVATAGEHGARPEASFEALKDIPPELINAADGFGLLATSLHRCDDAGGDCSPQAVPTFLRYDDELRFVQAEPLFLGEPVAVATYAWGLRCGGDHCIALASSAGSPTSVFAVDLPRRASPFEAPHAPPSAPSGAPRASGIVTLASGSAFIDMAAAKTGDTTLVVTLADGGEVASARRLRGTVALRAFDETGRPLETGTTLTKRAVFVGRVAIATTSSTEAAIAWVALDGRDSQVHIARVDSHGHVLKEAQITKVKGDRSSVAIVWADEGWLVAWVDTRDGNGEVYATKMDRNLKRIAPVRRITDAPGDAADVSLSASGETAWLAWSDPRESPKEGIGDVFVTTLSAHDAKRQGEEVRVLATAAHSRSPELAVVEGGALIAWIEDAPPGIEAPAAALLARLDMSGRVVGVPASLGLAELGRPTNIALTSFPRGAQAVVARSADAGVTLDAFSLSPDGRQQPPWPIADLDAPPSFDVVLALAGGAAFFDDVGASATEHRVRRVAVSW
jgi:hypothetical protein